MIEYLEVEINLDQEAAESRVRYPEGSPGHCPGGVVKGWVEGEHSLLEEVLYLAVIRILDPDLPVMSNILVTNLLITNIVIILSLI